jgi:hypothetical protein
MAFVPADRPTHNGESASLATEAGQWAIGCRAWILPVLCVFLSACQPDGPIAEVRLGWGYEYEALARLEKIFLLSGFRIEELSSRIKSEFGRNSKVKYIDSERCVG